MIIFASQTGNGESIANLLQKKINHSINCMNTITITDIESPLIIIVSTTGEGEIPDNGKKFYRMIKKNKPDLSDIDYSILGLGDSNYTNFCNGGKLFDSLLNKLNANRKKVIMADEVLGLEKFVEPWMDEMKSLYKNENLIVNTMKKRNIGKIIQTQYVTSRVMSLDIQISDNIKWECGQSIIIYMPNEMINRQYSIASSPLQKEKYKKLRIIFTIIGKCTQWLSTLKINDTIEYNLSTTNSLVFDNQTKSMIAIGSGLSPFLGFLWDNYYLHNTGFTLYYGCRTPNDIIFKEELDLFIKKGILSKIIYAFSRSEKNEYITDKLNFNTNEKKIWVCGNKKLIKNLKEKYKSIDFIHESWN